MAGDRPGPDFIFKTPADLERAIEEYFGSCWEEHWIQDKRTDKWVQVKDRHGNPMLRQHTPYTMSGLAVGLGISRMGLLKYRRREKYGEIVHKAKDLCEKWLEEGMLRGNIPAIPGIFNAKNNYGWCDKTEMELLANVVEMPSITIEGKELDFDIGITSDLESA